jgi:hypothetical protein
MGSTLYLDTDEAQFVFDKIRALDGGATNIVRLVYVDSDFVNRSPSFLAWTVQDDAGKHGIYEGFIVIPIKNASNQVIPAHEVGHAVKMNHPPVASGRPYMLMINYDTSTFINHTEFFVKRFRKTDLDSMLSSPRPPFVQPLP